MSQWLHRNRNVSSKVSAEILIAFFLFSASASAIIADFNPAPFRGRPNTTFQAWDFLTRTNPAFPEAGWFNPFGTPFTDLLGDVPYIDSWLINDHGHQGVWIVGHADPILMVSTIPNVPDPGISTDVWVQIVYSSTDFLPPDLFMLPDGLPFPFMSTELIEKKPHDDWYYYALYHATIRPGFKFCQLLVRPMECTVNIDSILVETLAVGVISPDIDGDGSVNLPDLILLAEQWTRSDCSASDENHWCSGTDITKDGTVNLDDLALVAVHWLTPLP